MSYHSFLESKNKNLRDSAYGWQKIAHQYSVVINAKDQRIAELESQVNHWKSNHDNQKTLKSQLMDRPDLKDRAASIQKLQDRISQLELDNESLRRERNNLIVQNEDLGARNKSLIEVREKLVHEAFSKYKLVQNLKVAIENFLANQFFGPQEYRNLREALNACNPHRGSNFDDFLKEDSENRD